jgi:hypothetical protein
MLKKSIKIGLGVAILSTGLNAASMGWYSANKCTHIESVGMYSPNELITIFGCKPTYMGKQYAGAARSAMLAYDCSQTKLKTYLIFKYQTYSDCLKSLKK